MYSVMKQYYFLCVCVLLAKYVCDTVDMSGCMHTVQDVLGVFV